MKDENIFRTVIKINESAKKIKISDYILCVGSCFAENIGKRLNDYCFECCINPCGPVFNPISLINILKRITENKPFTKNALFFADGMWHSWDHHSRFSNESKESCLKIINQKYKDACEIYRKCNTLILTMGTAFVYRLKSNNKIVSNCHKQPHNIFIRECLTIKEIVDEYSNFFNKIFKEKPALNCIITISPVRHLRDNPHENFISKSILACAIEEILKMFPILYYFPTYEIMMDDLRDYRFYDKDMVHPNEIALDYIWNKFVDACFDDKAKNFVLEYSNILSAMEHNILHKNESSKKFIISQLAKLREIKKQYPEAKIKKAEKYFKELLR